MEMKSKIISERVVLSYASGSGMQKIIQDSWGNVWAANFWPDMPEEYLQEFAAMQAMACQNRVRMPDLQEFLQKKKQGKI